MRVCHKCKENKPISRYSKLSKRDVKAFIEANIPFDDNTRYLVCKDCAKSPKRVENGYKQAHHILLYRFVKS